MLLNKLSNFCDLLVESFDLIPRERKEKLIIFSNYISKKVAANEEVKLIFVCTHNSRRSHIGQLCMAIGASYYGLSNISTFSGGTEVTAFNARAVKAWLKTGLDISTTDSSKANPIYSIKWEYEMSPYLAFSKTCRNKVNPKNNFAAIMVCSEAEKACPMILGAEFKLALPYQDPKQFDNTRLESIKYEEKIKEIGREIFFVLETLSKL